MAGEPPYVRGSDFNEVFQEELRQWVLPAAARRQRRKPQMSEEPELQNELVGVALSGGGIRSATFALGVCQALAKYGVLEQADYLSTVSGGTYLGSAISSLLHWAEPPRDGHPLSPENFPFRFGPNQGSDHMRQFKAERAPVRHLREMSNYLAPRLGLFDTQTWYAVARVATFALLMLVFLALPPVIVTLAALTSLPLSVWSRPLPMSTPWIFTWPLAISGIALAAFAVTSLGSYREGSPLNVLRRVLLLCVLGGLTWAGFVLTVQVAWGVPDWVKATFGTGLIALIAASRWGFSQMGDVSKRFEAELGHTTVGRWVRMALPQLLFGLLGYAVLGLSIVLLYVVVDSVAPGWTRLVLILVFGLITILTLTRREVAGVLNASSLHAFYRSRLGDCYIQQQGGDDIVVAGQAADVPLAELQTDKRARGDVLGPYHIIGAALNISGSTDVHRLGRRSDAFFLSPLYSGSSITGYARTAETYPDLTLGAAMAISGSAFSPNQGSATQTTLSVLLTLLNARLGYWADNPAGQDGAGEAKLSNAAPLVLYWKEMFGRASSGDRAVYLSDGGHFDNSGIYELVRRRCRYIVAIDGSGETVPESPRFGTFGLVSRLVRIDFGVDIQLDLASLAPDSSGRAPANYAVGRVIYPKTSGSETEDDRTGVIILLKATLTKAQTSPDLEFYKRLTGIFPNHSTVDQFFDEGQFEAYRALGYEEGRAVFKEALAPPVPPSSGVSASQVLCDMWNQRVMSRNLEVASE
jgi:hypothetical protein